MTSESTPFRLTRLRIKNFRSIREADIPLGPLTVLVGPNGAGKSNVLDALRFMRDCLTRGVDQALLDRGGLNNIQYWSSGGQSGMSLSVSYEQYYGLAGEARLWQSATYRFVLTANAKLGYFVEREDFDAQRIGSPRIHSVRIENKFMITRNGLVVDGQELDKLKKIDSSRLLGPSGMCEFMESFPVMRVTDDDPFPTTATTPYYGVAWDLESQVDKTSFYALNPVQLRVPQRLVFDGLLMEEGQNLAAVLRKIRRDPFIAGEVLLVLQRLLQDVTDFSVATAGSYLVTNLHYGSPEGSMPRLSDLDQESDGTIRTLGIVAALYQMPSQALMAFEEPETAIHPGMLAVLAELFVVTSERSQILLTTHSPDLLDYLPPDSFLVVEKVNGETRVGPLADYQRETIRQKLFTPGEILRSEGLHRDEPLPTE